MVAARSIPPASSVSLASVSDDLAGVDQRGQDDADPLRFHLEIDVALDRRQPGRYDLDHLAAVDDVAVRFGSQQFEQRFRVARLGGADSAIRAEQPQRVQHGGSLRGPRRPAMTLIASIAVPGRALPSPGSAAS